MSKLTSWSVFWLVFVVLIASRSSVRAGDGFPPFGAWAYGTGASFHRHLPYGGGPSGYAYRGYYRLPTFWSSNYYGGWGGYRYLALATTRRHTVGFVPAHFTYSVWYPSYRRYGNYCAAAVSYPAYYFPTLAEPGCYSLPSYSASFGFPLCSPWQDDYSVLFDQGPAALSMPDRAGAIDTSKSAELRAVDYAQPTDGSTDGSHAVPESLLAAADAIFQAGGYREAAAAYARINVRYGSSDKIFGRRFIAQVASGDMDQAAVILASAKAAGFKLHRRDLPGGNLEEMFSNHAELLSATTELLAAQALRQPAGAEAMEAIGQWLNLAGDGERSTLFLAMAEQISNGLPLAEQAIALSKPEFISLE